MSTQNIPHMSTVVDCKEEGVYPVYDLEHDLVALETLIKEFVEADCHAVILNGEVLLNSYDRSQGYREQILEYAIREQIMNNPHRHIMVPLLRQHKDFTIEIFMFAQQSWKLEIQYNHVTQKFHVCKKV